MFVAGLLPDLGGQSSIGTPNADLGPVRLMMRDGSGNGGQDQDRMTARPGDFVDVDVYVDRTDMRLGGIFLRLGGELPKGVDVYMDDNYAYAFDGNKEYFQVGNFFLCDTLQSGDPQEVYYTEALLQFRLKLPADLKSGAYEISPIDFCQLFSDGTSHIYDVTYSPLVLCVPEEGGGTPDDLLLTYAVWAAANGTTGAWNATDASGVHNVFRYLFDIRRERKGGDPHPAAQPLGHGLRHLDPRHRRPCRHRRHHLPARFLRRNDDPRLGQASPLLPPPRH